MAKVNETELPIKSEPEQGPGVDLWNQRKENNDNERFTSEKLEANFDANRPELFSQLRKILD